MPRRPTLEFYEDVYPQVYRYYHKKLEDELKAEKVAREVTGSIWKKLKPSTKRKFEHARAVRERKERR
jgi:hypothetical protein